MTQLRADMALGGAAALERQGFLDTAQEILHQFASSAGASAAAATAEAKLRLLLAQVRHVLSSKQLCGPYLNLSTGGFSHHWSRVICSSQAGLRTKCRRFWTNDEKVASALGMGLVGPCMVMK